MIRIKNIYYMLSYAFQILNEREYKSISTEEFENSADLCAAILIKGVTSQIKRGLRKEYILNTEETSLIKGKIDISNSIKQQSYINRKMICNYDEFSVNNYVNKILKTTMLLLLRSDINAGRKKELKKLLLYFVEVDVLAIRNIDWNVQYNRNNQTYQMLISICYLIIKGLLQTTSDGNTKLLNFFDKQRMYRLYEKFILEYYKKEHPRLKVSASQIPWALDDDMRDMLPIMQSDIMLRYGEKTLIIDAKYYAHTLQSQYNTQTLHSNNLYQIFTYVKNFDRDMTGNVSGMLLYAKTDENVLPKNIYKMSGNMIVVETLDLGVDFALIRKALDDIADEYLYNMI